MIVVRLGAAILALSGATSAIANGCVDVPGEDHPRLQRYADACLIANQVKEFDSVVLPTGPVVSKDGKRTPERTESLEGRVTRLMYLAPPGRSSLEVFRNYKVSLEGPRRIGKAGQYSSTAFSYNVSDRRYLARVAPTAAPGLACWSPIPGTSSFAKTRTASPCLST